MKKSKKPSIEIKNDTAGVLEKNTKNDVDALPNSENNKLEVKQSSSNFKLNLKAEDIYQGIILSEILGKPLSKRRSRKE
jgi:hypothetical protein